MEYEILNGIGYRPDAGDHSGRPSYTGPEPFTPPAVTAQTITFTGTTFEQAQAAAEHVQTAYLKHLQKVNEDKGHYTPEGYNAQVDKFTDTEAYKSLDTHLDAVNTRLNRARTDTDKARAHLSPNGDTAAELRANRYWNRTKALLDTQTDTSKVMAKAQELIASATREELGTLLQELQTYCTTRGVTTTNWIDTAIGKAAPEYGTAVKQRDKAEQAAIMATHNIRRLQTAIGKRSQTLVPIARPNRPGDYDPDK